MNSPYNKALDYLSRREHSRAELHQKLRTNDFSEEAINEALNKLSTNNLQSDERFAASYVRHRQQAGFGPLRITAELRERGISEALIDAIVDTRNQQWREQITTVWKKKFSAPATTLEEKQRQYRFLYQRGFEASDIADFLKLF